MKNQPFNDFRSQDLSLLVLYLRLFHHIVTQYFTSVSLAVMLGFTGNCAKSPGPFQMAIPASYLLLQSMPNPSSPRSTDFTFFLCVDVRDSNMACFVYGAFPVAWPSCGSPRTTAIAANGQLQQGLVLKWTPHYISEIHLFGLVDYYSIRQPLPDSTACTQTIQAAQVIWYITSCNLEHSGQLRFFKAFADRSLSVLISQHPGPPKLMEDNE